MSSREREPSDSSAGTCELLGEREVDGAWEYDVNLVSADGALRRRVLRLSWSDYQMWSPDGGLTPSRVADAVLRFIAAHAERFEAIERIDASAVRRRVPGADASIAGLLRD